jgi:hypothetical protein
VRLLRLDASDKLVSVARVVPEEEGEEGGEGGDAKAG